MIPKKVFPSLYCLTRLIIVDNRRDNLKFEWNIKIAKFATCWEFFIKWSSQANTDTCIYGCFSNSLNSKRVYWPWTFFSLLNYDKKTVKTSTVNDAIYAISSLEITTKTLK